MKNRNDFYMSIAYTIAKASYAERNKVGAVLVKDDNIIAFGYNGTPRGFDNKCEIIPEGAYPHIDNAKTKPEVLHAESNAITKCAQTTGNSKGATLYVTVAPCFDCAKLIIQAGISRVYYDIPYRLRNGIELLKQAKIKVYNLK